MRVAAILFILRTLVFLAALIYMGYAFRENDHEGVVKGGIGILLAGLITIIQWIIANRANCPLCMTPVLGLKNCTKHRHAKTLFGSHRLRTSLSILFRGSFRCPYCNEPSEMSVRTRRRHRQGMH